MKSGEVCRVSERGRACGGCRGEVDVDNVVREDMVLAMVLIEDVLTLLLTVLRV